MRGEEVFGCLGRPSAVPFERLVNLCPSSSPDNESRYLAESGAEFVAERGPRDASVGVGVGLGFSTIELSDERRRQWGRSGCVEAIPEPTHECDALLSG